MYTTKITSPIVLEYWKDQFQGEVLCDNPAFTLFLNDELEEVFAKWNFISPESITQL